MAGGAGAEHESSAPERDFLEEAFTIVDQKTFGALLAKTKILDAKMVSASRAFFFSEHRHVIPTVPKHIAALRKATENLREIQAGCVVQNRAATDRATLNYAHLLHRLIRELADEMCTATDSLVENHDKVKHRLL